MNPKSMASGKCTELYNELKCFQEKDDYFLCSFISVLLGISAVPGTQSADSDTQSRGSDCLMG